MDLNAAIDEIDELKLSLKKLTEGYNAKLELSDRLRRANDEQLTKLQEAKKDLERKAQELQTNSKELSLAKQMCQDLRSSLQEKESVAKRLASSNDHLRSSYGDKLQKLEGKNRELVFSLDEANAKVEDQEKMISDYKKQIAGLRGLLSDSQKKCSEAELKIETFKELRGKEAVLLQLEEENVKVGEQLKWKKEQFKHLEEAHQKVQDEFHSSKMKWESEKSAMIDDICSLRVKLESRNRVMEDLRSQLQLCNQALAHEESRRKMLEIQVSESKTSYDNVVTEYEEVKLKFEKLTEARDEDVSRLRNFLASKETILKEIEFQNTRLQQDNDELQASLKEFQEAQINEVGVAAALKTLRQRFRSLEQTHKGCLTNLKSKEAEWSSRVENLREKLDCHVDELEHKERQIQQLQMETEEYHSLAMQLKLKKTEMDIVILLLFSRISETSSSNISDQNDLQEVKRELDHWKSVAEQENKLKLDSEVQMKALLDKCQHIKSEMEDCLLAKLKSEKDHEKKLMSVEQEIEHRDEKMTDLRQEIVKLQEVVVQRQSDAAARANMEAKETFEREKQSILKIVEEKSKRADSLQTQVAILEEECISTEMEAAVKLEQERESLLNIIKSKDIEIADLNKHILSQEQLTKSVGTAIDLEFAERQFEIDSLNHSFKKIAADHFLDMHDKEFRGRMIDHLEEEHRVLKAQVLDVCHVIEDIHQEKTASSKLGKLLERMEIMKENKVEDDSFNTLSEFQSNHREKDTGRGDRLPLKERNGRSC